MHRVVGIGGAQIRERERGRRKWSVADRRTRTDGSTAEKKFEEGKQKRFGWDGGESGLDGGRGSVAFYGIAAESS